MIKSISQPGYRALLKWLYDERIRQNLSMRDLAALIGEPHSIVQKIENGERRLDLGEYVQYCTALRIDPAAGLKVFESRQVPCDGVLFGRLCD